MLPYRRPKPASRPAAEPEVASVTPAAEPAAAIAYVADQGEVRGGSAPSRLRLPTVARPQRATATALLAGKATTATLIPPVTMARAAAPAQAPAKPAAPADPRAVAMAWLERGDALALISDHAAAERAYRAAILVRPVTTAAHLKLGVLLFKRRRLAEALKALEQAIALDRTAVGARYHVALIAFESGDGQRATAQLTWIKRIRPELPEAYLLQAAVFERQGDRPSAAAELHALLALAPGHAGAWLRLGKLQLAMGDRQGALTALERACRLDPRLAEAHFGRGRLLEAAERLTEAGDAYRAALAAGMNREAVEERLAILRRRRSAAAGVRGLAA